MARLLLLAHQSTNIHQAGLALTGLLLCGIALFACVSRSRKWRRWKACYGSYNEGPVIELNNESTMLGNGVYGFQGRNVDASMFSGEQQRSGPVWKKNILMGEKCQLPDFSGVIIYDSEGNVVNPANKGRPLLTWK